MNEPITPPVPVRRWHYAWVVAAVTFLVLIVSAAVRSTPSILIVPLEAEFGWSRASISLAVSINLLLYGLIGPFAAGLFNRYGPRRILLLSLGLLATGVALTTCIHTTPQLLLLWGILVGCGTGITAMVLGATVVNRWFHAHRGLLIGVLTASTATGQLLFLPLLANVVQHHGWRLAVLIVAGCLALLFPLVFFLMRDRPADIGLRPYGWPATEPAPAPPPAGNPFTDALNALATGLRSRDFWLLAGSFFICGAS
ncbi:MAG TPA: MFS transporter, partial [Verrucomicrobiae bacterium]